MQKMENHEALWRENTSEGTHEKNVKNEYGVDKVIRLKLHSVDFKNYLAEKQLFRICF